MLIIVLTGFLLCVFSYKTPKLTLKVIMVGPGTGLAPFKAMIEEREATRLASPRLSSKGPEAERVYDWLFFGCRKQAVDFYYRKELEGFALPPTASNANGNGSMSSSRCLSLHTAFSRDVPEGTARVYVTHRLREVGGILWDLLSNKNASFFVAGSAKSMPTDVMNAIKSIAKTHGGLDEVEAEKFVMGLVRARRYCVESWSV